MPTAEQIAELRRMIAELTDAIYNDALLITYLQRFEYDTGYDLNAAAGTIWLEKAALYVSSSWSTETLWEDRAKLADHANKMHEKYWRLRVKNAGATVEITAVDSIFDEEG